MTALKQTLLDKAITHFSPERGLRRMQARTRIEAGMSYRGAQVDRTGRLRWQPVIRDANADTVPDLRALRAGSRDLIRNAPLALGAVNTVTTNVVGSGLKLRSQMDREILAERVGLTDDEIDALEMNFEREWELWSESEECDLSRTQCFGEMQELVFRSALESGDCMQIMRFVERNGSPYGLKMQTIEADRVSNPGYRLDGQQLANGRKIIGGIELEATGAPTAIYVSQHPGALMPGAMVWKRMNIFGQKSGMRQVIHLYDKLRPDQVRGVPYIAPVLETFKLLDRYTEAEVHAAVVSALLTVFVKSEGDADFDTTEEDGYNDDYKVELGNGAVAALQPNETIEIVNPGRPNQAFDPFIMAVMRQIGVGLELPFEILVKHFTRSYSAARAAMLEAWKFYRKRRVWLSRRVCQPTYEALIWEAVARGRVSAPGFLTDPLLRKAYLGSEWIGPAPGQIDPAKEMDAVEKKLALNISSRDAETAKIDGTDSRKVRRQIEKEKKMDESAGLSAPAPSNAPALPAPVPEDADAGDTEGGDDEDA